jgi:hypothetical protein
MTRFYDEAILIVGRVSQTRCSDRSGNNPYNIYLRQRRTEKGEIATPAKDWLAMTEEGQGPALFIS